MVVTGCNDENDENHAKSKLKIIIVNVAIDIFFIKNTKKTTLEPKSIQICTHPKNMANLLYFSYN
ncbi:MAG: hypothetical protein ACTSO2_05680 [Promethearchaeota archaeon]